MSYPIEEIEGVGAAYAEKLASAGIKRTDDLLAQCGSARGRSEVAGRTGLSEKLLLKWANIADLMRISGVGKEFSELLEAAGVDTVRELQHRNAENLTEKMKDVNEAKKLTRRVPNLAEVEKWIEQAKQLPATISH
jgi:hypothetical protein